jgi:hypothetical protein
MDISRVFSPGSAQYHSLMEYFHKNNPAPLYSPSCIFITSIKYLGCAVYFYARCAPDKLLALLSAKSLRLHPARELQICGSL